MQDKVAKLGCRRIRKEERTSPEEEQSREEVGAYQIVWITNHRPLRKIKCKQEESWEILAFSDVVKI